MEFYRIVCATMLVLLGLTQASKGVEKSPGYGIVQYGEMHVAIGQQKHHGRIRLGELTKKPNFYAVAALADLEGEVTIMDSEIVATVVDKQGMLKSASGNLQEKQATLLAGAYVAEWTEVSVSENVAPDDFDTYISREAEKLEIPLDKPFVFTVDGKLMKVRMHVIKGACPIRARMKKIQLPKGKQAYEKEMGKIEGKVIGIFAKDAVGKLTHPATTTHGHILYQDQKTGERVTGHLEAVGLHKGALLRFPKQ